MSASTDYTDTLKKIKETEQQGARELSERKKVLEDELRRLEEESAKSIAAARAEAEKYVSDEVTRARESAQADSSKTLAATQKEAEANASKRLDRAALAKIVTEMLSEFRES
jgi:vacuolar-type H+-ATPase subunit H